MLKQNMNYTNKLTLWEEIKAILQENGRRIFAK